MYPASAEDTQKYPLELNAEILMALCDWCCQRIIQLCMGTGRPVGRVNGERATLLAVTS
jgi:hypothetical protein